MDENGKKRWTYARETFVHEGVSDAVLWGKS